MDLDFTPEQKMLGEAASRFFAEQCPYHRVKELEESEEGYDPRLWKKMADLGWLGMLFPEEYGGWAGQFTDALILQEKMGAACFPSPFFSTVIQCGLLILEGGNEEQKRALLEKVSSGDLIMALARYEEDGGESPSSIQMEASEKEGGYVLNGVKLFVADANVAEKLIAVARVVPGGITLFLVDANAPGVACVKMPTVAKDNTCEVVFRDVRVGREAVIGTVGKGWELLESISARATLAKCAEMLGACKASIEMTASYAKERVQYDRPIGSFQIIQHYMANMLLAYDTSYNYLYKVGWMMDRGMDCVSEVSALKACLNRSLLFITERAVQIHGAIGTTRECDIGLFYRRAKAWESAAGDTIHHLEKIASFILDQGGASPSSAPWREGGGF
jgi:alkylation response protein AidB-like acyl-CoA dehydrogenase